MFGYTQWKTKDMNLEIFYFSILIFGNHDPSQERMRNVHDLEPN
jgi:hypothetical protein